MIVRQKKRGLSRKTLVITAVILLVIASGVIAVKYGLFAAADAEAKASLTETKAKVTDASTKVNTLISDEKQTVGAKVSAVSEYKTQLQGLSQDVCKDARALIYYSFITHHDDCEAATKALTAVSAASADLYGFLSDEETIAALLPADGTSLTYVQHYDLWNRTTGLLKSAKSGSQAQELKTAVINAASSYAEAWYDVVQADNKKDEAAFDKAEAKVKSSYSALTAVATISTKTLQDLTSVFNAKYAAYTALKLTQ
jgi:hypothetical protein